MCIDDCLVLFLFIFIYFGQNYGGSCWIWSWSSTHTNILNHQLFQYDVQNFIKKKNCICKFLIDHSLGQIKWQIKKSFFNIIFEEEKITNKYTKHNKTHVQMTTFNITLMYNRKRERERQQLHEQRIEDVKH